MFSLVFVIISNNNSHQYFCKKFCSEVLGLALRKCNVCSQILRLVAHECSQVELHVYLSISFEQALPSTSSYVYVHNHSPINHQRVDPLSIIFQALSTVMLIGDLVLNKEWQLLPQIIGSDHTSGDAHKKKFFLLEKTFLPQVPFRR